MPVISVVGAPGVGKSLLVKQLAARNLSPAFFEGEEGTIPSAVLEKVFSDPDPVQRFAYFTDRYVTNLNRARQISDLGLTVYVDGGALSIEAMLRHENQDYRAALDAVAAKVVGLKSDCTVLLIADEAVLRARIENRGRRTEAPDAALTRSCAIQARFQEVAKGRAGVLVIDCSQLSFNKEADLDAIHEKIAAAQ